MVVVLGMTCYRRHATASKGDVGADLLRACHRRCRDHGVHAPRRGGEWHVERCRRHDDADRSGLREVDRHRIRAFHTGSRERGAVDRPSCHGSGLPSTAAAGVGPVAYARSCSMAIPGPRCLYCNGLDCTGTRSAHIVEYQAPWQSHGATRPNHRPRLRSSHWGGAAHRESPWPFGSRRVHRRHTSTPQTLACSWISPDSPVTSWRSTSGPSAAG